jgi:hypothetical protein
MGSNLRFLGHLDLQSNLISFLCDSVLLLFEKFFFFPFFKFKKLSYKRAYLYVFKRSMRECGLDENSEAFVRMLESEGRLEIVESLIAKTSQKEEDFLKQVFFLFFFFFTSFL